MGSATKKKTRADTKKKAPPAARTAKKATAEKTAGQSAGRKGAKKATSPPGTKAKAKAAGAPDRSAPQTAEVDADVLEFIAAIDKFKQQNGRPFPSWSEVLLVVRELGYRRD